MQKSTKAKILGGTTALVMACGLAVAGSSVTSAYFSDTNDGGAITTSLGSIKVNVDESPTATPNLDLSDLLPGQAESDTFTVANAGRSAQDVHLSFDDPTVLGLINRLGTYGEVTIKVDGKAVFYSANLNDDPEDQGQADINPLPSKLKIIDDFAAGDTADVEFRFGFSEKLTNAANLPIEFPMSLPYSVIATQPGIAPGA